MPKLEHADGVPRYWNVCVSPAGVLHHHLFLHSRPSLVCDLLVGLFFLLLVLSLLLVIILVILLFILLFILLLHFL